MTNRPNTETLERALEAAREKIGRLERALVPFIARRRGQPVDEDMPAPTPAGEAGERFCCQIDCDAAAEYEVWYGKTPDDYIDACIRHVGELLGDAPCNYVYPLNPHFGGARPDLVVIDDPLAPVASIGRNRGIGMDILAPSGSGLPDPAEVTTSLRLPEPVDGFDTAVRVVSLQDFCETMDRIGADFPEARRAADEFFMNRGHFGHVLVVEPFDPLAEHEWARDVDDGYTAKPSETRWARLCASAGVDPEKPPFHGRHCRQLYRLIVAELREEVGEEGRWIAPKDDGYRGQDLIGVLAQPGGDWAFIECRYGATHRAPGYSSLGDDGDVLVWVEPIVVPPHLDLDRIENIQDPELRARLRAEFEASKRRDGPATADEAIADFVETFKGKEGEFRPIVIEDQVTVRLQGTEADPLVYLREALNTRMPVPTTTNELVIPAENAGTDAAVAVFDGKGDEGEKWVAPPPIMGRRFDVMLGRGVVIVDGESRLANEATHRIIAYRHGSTWGDVLVRPVEGPTIVTYNLSTGPDWTDEFHVSLLAFPPGMVTPEGHIDTSGMPGDGIITPATIEALISEGGQWLGMGARGGQAYAKGLDQLMGDSAACRCAKVCKIGVEHRYVAWRTRGDDVEVLVKPMDERAAQEAKERPRLAAAFHPPLHGKTQILAELKRLRALRDKVEYGGGVCLLAGPGRGDCEHAVGLPGKSIPGQHDGDDDTVDAYGKPNGWCWSCWKSEEIIQLQREVKDLGWYFEKGIENDARLAGVHTDGVVGLALVHMLVEEIEKLRAAKAEP